MFKFGGGECLKSIAPYDIPAYLGGKKVIIRTDVVPSDIPLLSLNAMKKAKIKLDLELDCATIFGKNVILHHTSSDLYCVLLIKDCTNVDEVYVVDITTTPKSTCRKTLLKLHKQFAHPPAAKLTKLLPDANQWKPDFEPILNSISESCEICKLYHHTPSQPVVCFSKAENFNEKVAMDLKKWGNRWILHHIDMWSRLTVSIFIDCRRPSDVIDNIMLHWVGAGFVIMKSIFMDNGGEFSSDKMREVCSILNVQISTTAANSPFQNGLCKRIHAVTDNMLLKL